jgi:hypothetical protein
MKRMVGKRADRSWIKSKIVAPAYPPYLATLSDDLLDELRQALRELDVDAVISAIKRVGVKDATLAKMMMFYADDFQYEQLAKFLEPAKAKALDS